MLQLENTKIGPASGVSEDDPHSDVVAFAIAALPCERFGSEAIFKEISSNLVANIRELSRHQSLSPTETREMEVAAYLLASAWIGSPTRLSQALETITEVFFRSFPSWKKSEKPIRAHLRAVSNEALPRGLSKNSSLFRDAVTAFDAKKEFEDPIIVRHRLFQDENQDGDEDSWLSEELGRLRRLKFATLTGELRFGRQLEKNIELLESVLSKKHGTRSSGAYQKMTLSIYRSVSRNMIDMLTLADRKAGLLLNANAISLTVLVSFFGRTLNTQPRLWASSILIGCTCALTVVFAALASRPLKRTRDPLSLDRFLSEGLSLLHYGDAARLSRDDFLKGFKLASNDPELLERNLLCELHFFATRVIEKFRMVRRAYHTMILGILLSGFALLLAHYF